MSGTHSEQMRVHLLKTAVSVTGELERFLERYGYHVQWHPDGATLANVAQKGNVETDCILIDAVSAEGDGLLLLRALQQAEDSPAVIFVAGLNDNAKRVERMLSCLIESRRPRMNVRVSSLSSYSEKPVAQSDHLDRFDALTCFEALTSRERQVLGLILQGMTSKKIARQLGISPRTVETHRVHIHAKLETKSLQELVWLAVDGGLIAPAA